MAVHKALSNTKTMLTNANKALNSSRMTIRRLETSPNEVCKGRKKGLKGPCRDTFKNIDMFKKYAKSIEHGYSILHDSFKNENSKF